MRYLISLLLIAALCSDSFSREVVAGREANIKKFRIKNLMDTCKRYVSAVEDPTPVQKTGTTIPDIINKLIWMRPTESTSRVSFSGTAGQNASHEGVDYVNNDQTIVNVPVKAACKGKVVYVREGCPQSSVFEHNNSARECGAGWGNHVVIKHGDQIYTRYGHLTPNSIKVNSGDSVVIGQQIALMGNSGRSELRHCHFELGTKNSEFLSCGNAQNFDAIFNPEALKYNSTTTTIDNSIKESNANSFSVYPNPSVHYTTIRFETTRTSRVVLNIMNLQGELIFTLVNGFLSAGSYTYHWDGSSFDGRKPKTGIYLSQLTIDSKIYVSKIVIL